MPSDGGEVPHAYGDEAEVRGDLGGPEALPYLRFRPDIPAPPPSREPERRWTTMRRVQAQGGVLLWVAALLAYLQGLLYIFVLYRLALDPWFLMWSGSYCVLAFAMGVVGGMCAWKGVRLNLVAASSIGLIVAGVFDLNMDGTTVIGVMVMLLSGAGLALAANPVLLGASGPSGTTPPLDVALGRASPWSPGLEGTHVPEPAYPRRRNGVRVLAGNLLGIASVMVLVEGIIISQLALWYHPSEGYLDVEWESLMEGLLLLASGALGLWGTYLVLKGQRVWAQHLAGVAVFMASTVGSIDLAYGWGYLCVGYLPLLVSFFALMFIVLANLTRRPPPPRPVAGGRVVAQAPGNKEGGEV